MICQMIPTIDFTIVFNKGKLDQLEKVNLDNECNGVHKALKLMTTSSTTNMNLFDSNDKLKKYDSVKEIIDDYFDTRLVYYQKRKDYLISNLEHQLLILKNKKKYIEALLNDELDLRKKKKDVIVKELSTNGYDKLEDDQDYKYLLKMTMDSVSEENVEKLTLDFDKKSK